MTPNLAVPQGIETVRRDNCLLVRDVITTSLEKMLIEKDVDGAVAYVKGMISNLLMNRIDLSLLVITKVTACCREPWTLQHSCVSMLGFGPARLLHRVHVVIRQSSGCILLRARSTTRLYSSEVYPGCLAQPGAVEGDRRLHSRQGRARGAGEEDVRARPCHRADRWRPCAVRHHQGDVLPRQHEACNH